MQNRTRQQDASRAYTITEFFGKATSRVFFVPVALISFFLGYALCDYRGESPRIDLSDGKAAIEVRFSPKGGCKDLVLDAIRSAEQFLWVHAYVFTSDDIADELIKAHRRGIDVRVIVDGKRMDDKYAKVKKLSEAGVCVKYVQISSGCVHNKIMIIDERALITGSFNWTKAAEERNQENMLRISSLDLNRCYRKNWQKIWETASLYQR